MVIYSQVLNSVLFFFLFPERKVFLKKLNNRFSISESFLINIIDLFESIRQGLFTEFASLLVVVHNFVVEDREVKSKSKSDWVACVQRFRGGLSKLIVLEGTVFNDLELVSIGALSNISVIISDHFVEETLSLIGGSDAHA
jgi:hypothetical protein